MAIIKNAKNINIVVKDTYTSISKVSYEESEEVIVEALKENLEFSSQKKVVKQGFGKESEKKEEIIQKEDGNIFNGRWTSDVKGEKNITESYDGETVYFHFETSESLNGKKVTYELYDRDLSLDDVTDDKIELVSEGQDKNKITISNSRAHIKLSLANLKTIITDDDGNKPVNYLHLYFKLTCSEGDIDVYTELPNETENKLKVYHHGMAIFIAFPDRPADIASNQKTQLFFEEYFGDNDGKVNDAGHAGVIIISRKNSDKYKKGDTKYFDFGRYDNRKDIPKGKRNGTNQGVVRSSTNVSGLAVPNWNFEKSDDENVKSIMTKLSNGGLFKGYGKMIGAIAKGLDFEKMMDYAITMENKGIIIFGGYESSCSTDNPTYCAKFARGVGEVGGVDWDFNSLRGTASVEDIVNDFESSKIEIPNK